MKINLHDEKENNEHNILDQFTTRPLHFKKDFEDLLRFTELVFADELDTFGGDLREMLEEVKKIYPLIRFLGIFKKKFRHLVDGYVVENDQKEWVATVISSDNNTYWEISNVATHPDYRRQGIAKLLVSKAIAHAEEFKANRMSLEVLENNEPAYKLYASLGFEPFDMQSNLECKSENFTIPPHLDFPDDYVVSPYSSKYPVKVQQYILKQNAISNEVQEYLPLKPPKRFASFLMRMVQNFAVKLVKLQLEGWLIYSKANPNEILGYAQIKFAKSAKDVHRFRVLVDPKFQDILYPPLISLLLETLKNHQKFEVPIYAELRSVNRKLVDLLKTNQFQELKRYQIMGRKTEGN